MASLTTGRDLFEIFPDLPWPRIVKPKNLPAVSSQRARRTGPRTGLPGRRGLMPGLASRGDAQIQRVALSRIRNLCEEDARRRRPAPLLLETIGKIARTALGGS